MRQIFLHKLCGGGEPTPNDSEQELSKQLKKERSRNNKKIEKLQAKLERVEAEKRVQEELIKSEKYKNQLLLKELVELDSIIFAKNELLLDEALLGDIVHDRDRVEQSFRHLKSINDTSGKTTLMNEIRETLNHLNRNLSKFKGEKRGILIDEFYKENHKVRMLSNKLGAMRRESKIV